MRIFSIGKVHVSNGGEWVEGFPIRVRPYVIRQVGDCLSDASEVRYAVDVTHQK